MRAQHLTIGLMQHRKAYLLLPDTSWLFLPHIAGLNYSCFYSWCAGWANILVIGVGVWKNDFRNVLLVGRRAFSGILQNAPNWLQLYGWTDEWYCTYQFWMTTLIVAVYLYYWGILRSRNWNLFLDISRNFCYIIESFYTSWCSHVRECEVV